MTVKGGRYQPQEPRSPNLLDAPVAIGQEVQEAVPELAPVLDEVADASMRFIKHAMGSYSNDGPGGVPVVLSQSLNDFMEILFDIRTGRGRSALRGTRGLFELLVTARDVMQDPILEKRYMDHESVVSQLEAALDFEAEHLPKRPRREDVRRRRRLAEATQVAYDSALETYGKDFKRRWAPRDLAARAKEYGLEKDYEFYRLSSAVLHGSSGGALGIKKVIEDRIVHRTGPSLLLCPLAFLQALRYFDMLLDTYGGTHPVTFTNDLRAAIAKALMLWPKYRRAVHRLDLSIWPNSPPPNLISLFVANSPSGLEKWFIHDPDAGLVIEAEAPKHIPDEQAIMLDGIRHMLYTEYPNSDEPLSAGVVGVDLVPKRGAKWEEDKPVLVREAGYPDE